MERRKGLKPGCPDAGEVGEKLSVRTAMGVVARVCCFEDGRWHDSPAQALPHGKDKYSRL
ncbi:Hypothetical predicted protein [Pelobates cultripes]|uniref:Uncharacterized protein n=1 Tax=Pelobates cultripes TaxID=61616 RepID=A0AAD1SIC3_PELCU|nr:Hypothetical predicted protein [Pelobates cultripes]